MNPALEKSLSGLSSSQGWAFAPSAKVSFDITKVIAFGSEYYASLGPIGDWSNWSDQQQQVFPTIDLNFSPDWEFNFGVGFGLTRSTDGLIIKLILGYRF